MKSKQAPVKQLWETCCAEPHADELDALRDHLAHKEREIIRLRDQSNIAARTERQREKDVYAAAKRAAWDHVLNCLKVYVLADAKRPLWDLVQAASEEPPVKVKDSRWLSNLRMFAYHVKEMLAGKTEPTNDGLVSELARFTAGLAEQTQKLHREYGTNTGERCGCLGCELTRNVYDYTLPADLTERAR